MIFKNLLTLMCIVLMGASFAGCCGKKCDTKCNSKGKKSSMSSKKSEKKHKKSDKKHKAIKSDNSSESKE